MQCMSNVDNKIKVGAIKINEKKKDQSIKQL